MKSSCSCCEGWPHVGQGWAQDNGSTLRKAVLNLIEEWMETGWSSDSTARRFTTLCQIMREIDPTGYAACYVDASHYNELKRKGDPI